MRIMARHLVRRPFKDCCISVFFATESNCKTIALADFIDLTQIPSLQAMVSVLLLVFEHSNTSSRIILVLFVESNNQLDPRNPCSIHKVQINTIAVTSLT